MKPGCYLTASPVHDEVAQVRFSSEAGKFRSSPAPSRYATSQAMQRDLFASPSRFHDSGRLIAEDVTTRLRIYQQLQSNDEHLRRRRERTKLGRELGVNIKKRAAATINGEVGTVRVVSVWQYQADCKKKTRMDAGPSLVP